MAEGFLLGFIASLVAGVDLLSGRPLLGCATAIGLWLLLHAFGFFLVGLVALLTDTGKKPR